MSIGNVLLWLTSLNPIRYKATKCGHRTKQTGRVSAFGQSTVMKMPKNKVGSVDYCLDCIGIMTVRCAWCCDPIFIGSSITLYSPGPREGFFSSREPTDAQEKRKQKDFALPDGAVIYFEHPLTLVGCLGWNCADTGADRAGFWLPGEDGKGRVQRVPTVLETLLGAEKDSVLVVDDLSDIKEARNPRLIPLESQKAK